MIEINPTNEQLDQIIKDHDLVKVPSLRNDTYIKDDKCLIVVFSPCYSYRKVFVNFEINP